METTMLTGLADLAMSHFESHVTPHLWPVPPELQFSDHPLDSCASLFVGVPNQLPANFSDYITESKLIFVSATFNNISLSFELSIEKSNSLVDKFTTFSQS